ncbi:hypothetical protein KIW74_gp45 [Mycobacterium phage Kimona]|uniref:Uncharacterized protein n=1 Tax=Mycobacterium phage Kimona TaxID=2024295 RepID=A0A249XU11_9CAUD|nr:hypothetical protein KIW74_gp45 [Mycobacterium phage Kimona]ASZ75483.1 hypothetical protein PBI_KIMONA_47 [Mycobacterium phage Kimona]
MSNNDSVLQVMTTVGVTVGVGEVVPAPDEGTDGRLYLLGEDGTHTVFNMRHVVSYNVTPYNEEENNQ